MQKDDANQHENKDSEDSEVQILDSGVTKNTCINKTEKEEKAIESTYVDTRRNSKKSEMQKIRQRIYFCHICDKSFELRIRLKHHIDKVHNKTNEKYSCHICDETFKRRILLRDHIEKLHDKI